MSGARLRRCLSNWEGFRSPISSDARSWRARNSLEGESRFISSAFSLLYGSWCGGGVMMSETSRAHFWSICESTRLNFARSSVMPAKKNCASARENYSLILSGQNGGSHTVTLWISWPVSLAVAAVKAVGVFLPHVVSMSVNRRQVVNHQSASNGDIAPTSRAPPQAPHNPSRVFTERVNKGAYHPQPSINCGDTVLHKSYHICHHFYIQVSHVHISASLGIPFLLTFRCMCNL
jgi:hypothetical protein